jgi:L-ribulose-5-phosphate 4-epimerase
MMDSHEVSEAAHQLVAAAQHLCDAGVISHSGHANLSVRLDANNFLLTPGLIRDLRAEQLVSVSHNGPVVHGALASSSVEIISMHRVVYESRPDVGAVMHTHSPSATAFAVAHRPLPCHTEALLRLGQADDILVVPWGPRGSDVSVRGIEEVLRQYRSTSAVLLANHGLLAFGPNATSTADLVVAVEESAEASLGAAILGGSVPFPDGALDALRESMARAAS